MKKLSIALTIVLSIAAYAFVKAQDADSEGPNLSAEEPVALDNMHHLMEYVFEPSYKRLKVSMASEPADRNAWKDIKGDSLTLAEATNLLFDRLPEDRHADWKLLAVSTREKGFELYQAARARDYAAATAAYRGMIKNCNACHEVFADGDYQLEP